MAYDPVIVLLCVCPGERVLVTTKKNMYRNNHGTFTHNSLKVGATKKYTNS